MSRYCGPAAVLVAVLLPSALALGQPGPDTEEGLLRELYREVGSDPMLLERALRERLVAAEDDTARATWTTGLARLYLRALDRPGAAVETLLGAEQWAGREAMDYIVRDVYGSGMERRIAAGALEATAKALELHPDSRALWVSAGRLRAFPGDHEGALEAWTKAQAIASTPHGLRGLSRTYRQLQRWEEALAAARQIPDLTVTEQAMYVAEPLQKLGRTDEIAQLADTLAARPDLSLLDLRSLAGIYVMADRGDRAEELLLTAVEQAGGDAAEAAKVRYSLASLYETRGELADAREQYALSAEGGLEGAQYWVARHVPDALGDPALLDRLVAACFVRWEEGWVESAIPSWFEELAGLPRWGAVMVDAAEKAGSLPDLTAALSAGLERHPDSAAHLLALVAAHYRTGDFARAAEAAQRLRTLYPEGVRAHRVGVLYERAGDHARAAEYFVDIEPGMVEPRAFRWIGQCYAALGQSERLDAIAAALRESGVGEFEAHAEGLLRFGAGQWEQAIPLLERAPKRPLEGAQRELAEAYVHAGRTEDAVGAYRDCLRTVSGTAWWEDANALAALLRKDATPQEYLPRLAGVMREEGVGNRGEAVRFWRELVASEGELGRLPALIEALKAETTAHADDGVLWAVQGLAQTKTEDWEAAVASFEMGGKHGAGWGVVDEYRLATQKRRERSPGRQAENAWQDFQQSFGPALQAGEWDRAAEIAGNLVAGFTATQSDQRDLALTQLAMNAKAGKPYGAFIAAVAVRAEQDPENPGATLLLAHCYYQNRQHAEAIDTLTKAEKLFEADSGAWVLLGRAHRQLGQRAEAAEAWRKALDLATTDAARQSIQKLLDEAQAP